MKNENKNAPTQLITSHGNILKIKQQQKKRIKWKEQSSSNQNVQLGVCQVENYYNTYASIDYK